MEEVKEDGPPSFPSNYVTIHQLKQRWLLQQLNPKPTIDDDNCDSKIQSQTIPPRNHRSINQRNNSASLIDFEIKPPQVPVHDDSKTTLPPNVDDNQDHKTATRIIEPAKPVTEIKQHQQHDVAPVKQAGHRSRNQKMKHKTKTPPFAVQNDDGDVAPVKDAGHQSRNQKTKHKPKTPPFTPENDNGGDGVVSEDVAVATLVKEQHQPGQRSKNKKVFRPKTPPSDAAGDDDLVEVEAVAVAAPVKLQHQAGRRSRNRKVFRPKTPPFDAAGDDNDDDGVVEVEAVAASVSVKEINVCNVSHTKECSERFQGGPEKRTWSRGNWHPKPPFGRKKGQMSQVWVKKGESAPN